MTMETPLILLHGALGSADQVRPLADRLVGLRETVPIEFPGHGGNPIPAEGLRMPALVDFLAGQLLQLDRGPVDVFGYSMGGYVAASTALRHPGLVRSLVTLGTKWAWDPAIAAAERRMLDPAVIEEKVPALVAQLQRRHHPLPWQDLVLATGSMLGHLGDHPLLDPAALSGLGIPVTILRGGEDRMVGREESEAAAAALPRGHYAELPGQKHPFEQTDLSLLLPWLT